MIEVEQWCIPAVYFLTNTFQFLHTSAVQTTCFIYYEKEKKKTNKKKINAVEQWMSSFYWDFVLRNRIMGNILKPMQST